MTVDQAYSELLLRIQSLETLYEQIDSHVLHSLDLFWTIVIGVFVVIGIALYFIAKSMVDKGIKDQIKDYEAKLKTFEKRISELENNSPQIARGLYIGSGTYGMEHNCWLTFNFEPRIVIIYAYESNCTDYALLHSNASGISFSTKNDSGTVVASRVLLSYKNDKSSSIAWYSQTNADQQLNKSGVKYYYIAIG